MGTDENVEVLLEIFRTAATLALAATLVGCASRPATTSASPSGTEQVEAKDTTPAPEIQEMPLVGRVWHWQRTLMYDDSVTEPADPQVFTLEFQPDGRLVARVDCNRGAGKYSVEGSRLRIEAMALTRAFCGPESLDTVFVQQLERVASYLMAGDELVLELEVHSGGMRFAPAP